MAPATTRRPLAVCGLLVGALLASCGDADPSTGSERAATTSTVPTVVPQVVVLPWDRMVIETVCVIIDETYFDTAWDDHLDELDELLDADAQIALGLAYYQTEADRAGLSFEELVGMAPEGYPPLVEGITPIADGLVNRFEARGVQAVTSGCDLTVRGSIVGLPLSESYQNAGTSYEGAWVAGSVVLEAPGQEPLTIEVRTERDPPGSIVVDPGDISGSIRSIDEAPFWPASQVSQSLDQLLEGANEARAAELRDERRAE